MALLFGWLDHAQSRGDFLSDGESKSIDEHSKDLRLKTFVSRNVH